jgi:biopolymer transport protein ExbD
VTVNEQNGKYRIMAEINMVPFIDVALVLLIIFMIMTPVLMRAQIKVQLPTAGKTEPATENPESVRVQVDKTGSIWIDGQSVPRASVLATVKQRLRHPQSQALIIEADRDAAFQHVVLVMDAGKQAGAAKLSVSVRQDASSAQARP